MKLIFAVIKPYRLDEVREALAGIGVEGMTMTEVRGFGRQLGHTEVYRGDEYVVDYLPGIRLDIVVDAERADAAVEAIRTAAHTGRIGDGKLFVQPAEEAVRIRTVESGAEAL